MNDGDEDYEDGEDFDHLADSEELERRAAFRRASYKVMTENNKDKEEDIDDDFGDFESATGETNSKQDWDTLPNTLDTLTINNKSPASPPQDDSHLVRAIKTKEEEFSKQKKDYQHDEEEQEGEV